MVNITMFINIIIIDIIASLRASGLKASEKLFFKLVSIEKLEWFEGLMYF